MKYIDRNSFLPYVTRCVWGSVRCPVWYSVRDAVDNSVVRSVRDSVEDSLWIPVRNQLKDKR